uniref:Isoflavone reductase n=1 Tax=Fagopyrum cymosum TaxID=62329 RepID=A7Y232_9CARY|nr:Isoflavone reductase [Fagopyrum cymosum]
MAKGKVLVVGGTGYIGRRLVEASLRQGHETFVLQRPEICFDIDKIQTLLALKKKGARVVEGSFSDHRSLVQAVKMADVVICPMSGLHFRTHNLLLQLKLVEAIKEAGNIKRFLPSEFGMDLARMKDHLKPGNVTVHEKMEVRNAIEDANIPFTYISANCLAGYFVGSLSQLGTLVPPKDNLTIYGDGNVKVVYVDDDDVATYTIKTIDDPRTLNKTLYIRPPENILSQRELIGIWEKLIGKELNKKSISGQELLDMKGDVDYVTQVIICRVYHIFIDGCLTNFKVAEDEEASKLYPEVNYKRMDEFLKIYIPN